MRVRMFVLITAVMSLVAGCGVPGSGVTATRSERVPTPEGGGLFPTDSTAPGGDPTGDTTPDTTLAPREYEVIDGVVDFGEAGPLHPEYDGFLTAAFGDIQDYWSDAFPDTYGTAWEPLAGGIYAAYPDRTAEIPGCGEPVSSYEDVRDGTAFYCIDGDFMAYDDADGLPALVDLLGKEAVAIVLAHEFGHAIQARSGEWDQLGVLKEQQADCFAGAWAAHVASGASDVIRFDDAAVRAGLVAMIYVRDPVESSGALDDPLAHGTGFDRVGAFKDGFDRGPSRCATFFTEDRLGEMIDIAFDSTDENAGNLPLVDPDPDPDLGPSDIITLIPNSLELFWTELAEANAVPFTPPEFAPFPTEGPYPACPSVDAASWPSSVQFCAEDNTIHWDEGFALELSLDELTGDMSVGYLLSNAYAEAIQNALGRRVTGEPRALFDDCLTGAWVSYIVPPIPDEREDQLVLSAGDLDEAIVTAIARADERVDADVNGSAFEKIGAFRTGVLGGLNECVATFG